MYSKLIRTLPTNYNLLVIDMQEEARRIYKPDNLERKLGFVVKMITSFDGRGNIVLTEMCDPECPIGPPMAEIQKITDGMPTYKKWSFGAFNHAGKDRLNYYLTRGIPTGIVGAIAEQCVLETALGAQRYGFQPIMMIEGIIGKGDIRRHKTEELDAAYLKYMENCFPIYISPQGVIPLIIRKSII